jgi:DNA repair protein RadC
LKKSLLNTPTVLDPLTYYKHGLPMKLWAEDDLPSYKLLMKGTSGMSDAELLSLVIGSGIAGENALDIAKTLLMASGNNLADLWKFGYPELMKIKGIGEGRALAIVAMFCLARRRNESEAASRTKISSSRDAFTIFQSLIGDLPYEEFWILTLNRANKVIKKIRISEGGISGTVVDPKKIWKLALDNGACNIILGHNHPSGTPTPSEADTKITKKIVDGGKLLEIAVLDHIIVGNDTYYSFADEGCL